MYVCHCRAVSDRAIKAAGRRRRPDGRRPRRLLRGGHRLWRLPRGARRTARLHRPPARVGRRITRRVNAYRAPDGQPVACAVGGHHVRRDNNIIELLNEVLTAELTSVNQYFVDSKMCANWGYERLAEKFREESIGEMKDADELIERILYLEGVPNLQRLGTVQRRRDRRREAAARARARTRGDRAAQHGHRGVRRAPATTAPASCSTTSSRAKRSTPTGSRRSSSSIRQVGEAHYLAQQIHD